ncbi:DinB family protein [Bacillus infantis]|uniref:DinB family protein n=1 Tax=Bacillus infantis TaxID=324767 RepID=UPI002FBF0E35
MKFKLGEAMEVLERTPQVLEILLGGLSPGWLGANEGEGTWNPVEVVDHLIEGEKHNWVPRLKFMLEKGEEESFPPFDRFSHLKKEEQTVARKLHEFKEIRAENLALLRELMVTEDRLEAAGKHPEFGTVKARELVSTWAVHDLTHLSQIARVMAERYRKDVGPWVEYLGILSRNGNAGLGEEK